MKAGDYVAVQFRIIRYHPPYKQSIITDMVTPPTRRLRAGINEHEHPCIFIPACKHEIIFGSVKVYLTGQERIASSRTCNRFTGLSMEFDKIHLKEAIVTWPDMHSFRYFDTFEFVKLSKRRTKMTHVILFR